MSNIEDRILNKCEPVTESGCWIWTGAAIRSKNGEYGVLRIDNKKNVLAHRLSAKYLGGMSIKGKVVRHKCDIPSCVNPNHLVVGSQLDNIQDRNKRGRTACGEKASRVKLTEQQVEQIKKSDMSQRGLGRIYGVCHGTIGSIKRGESWRCLISE